MKWISLFLIFLLFSACGYRPSAKFSRVVLGEKVSTSVFIASVDPENSVVIKDAMDLAISEVFHASLTSKDKSYSHLNLSLGNPVYLPIQYDSDGFVISYRTTIRLVVQRVIKGNSKRYTVVGTHDFSVKANAIISDQQRFDAIKFSSIKAIKAFVAQISAEGAREKKDI
ncbi:hypothetical protein JHD48_02775 [Sulfurimonas sp. SAG-AH-194-I05]|nr:hypothetical protein [Sulfurimonas sp. SAG-AH-194-I05]MDF1874655.1 hypothetical protein [Sulfurimonas sp. SAG-AH-194-I05]